MWRRPTEFFKSTGWAFLGNLTSNSQLPDRPSLGNDDQLIRCCDLRRESAPITIVDCAIESAYFLNLNSEHGWLLYSMRHEHLGSHAVLLAG
jgi:hypothetical protein